MTLGSELDWGFKAQPNPDLNGRAIGYSMGKVLEGGSQHQRNSKMDRPIRNCAGLARSAARSEGRRTVGGGVP